MTATSSRVRPQRASFTKQHERVARYIVQGHTAYETAQD